jgi:hypothetical protein
MEVGGPIHFLTTSSLEGTHALYPFDRRLGKFRTNLGTDHEKNPCHVYCTNIEVYTLLSHAVHCFYRVAYCQVFI